MGGGIGRIEMLNKSNILALVGGGRYPKFSKNKIIIWDDHQGKVISQLRFNSNVINVKIRVDSIIGICEKKIYVFGINKLDTIDILDTCENSSGLACVSSNISKFILVFPSPLKGKVQTKNYTSPAESILISAHESNIAYLALNNEGNLLATASDKGTIIRVYNTLNKEPICELRRGTKNVLITSISFDPTNSYIACTSIVGTVHIFSIKEANKDSNEKEVIKNEEIEQKNQKGLFRKLSGMFKIGDSERSFSKFKIKENNSIIGFCENNTIIVVTSEGRYYKAKFDPVKGGKCCLLEESDIIQSY